MRDKLKRTILMALAKGQMTHGELTSVGNVSASTINVTLRELIETKSIHKMRVGRNVYYALPSKNIPKSEKEINDCILATLSDHPSLTLMEITKRCSTYTPDDVAKAVAKLVFTSKMFKHTKENSKHIRYSTSNFVKGLLLVNSKRRKLDERSDNVVGPFLRQFLFNLPYPNDGF